MTNTGFSMHPSAGVEFELLDNFRGKIADCLFAHSRPLDPAGVEIGIEVPQLIVVIRPTSEEHKDLNNQIAFYSMGTRKEFHFREAGNLIIGAEDNRRQINGGYIAEGPKLNTKCRAFRLFDRMVLLRFEMPVEATDCRLFVGTEWDWVREEPLEMKGFKEKQILLPVVYHGRLDETTTVGVMAATDVEALLLSVADGKIDPTEFIPAAYAVVRDRPDAKALISAFTTGKWVKDMVDAGRLFKTANPDGAVVLHRLS